MILNLHVTHKKASVPTLEAATFENQLKAVKDILSLDSVKESAILQTCHRVEIFVVATSGEAKEQILDYWVQETRVAKDQLLEALDVARDPEALHHLLSLAAGLKSMIVGEDQILGQVKDTYTEALRAGTLGPVLKTVFMKAISAGRRVRNETAINEGSVSIGSAGIDLAERILGDLHERRVLVVGAGELGTLVGKALAKRRLPSTFVANRTYEKGVRLARMINGFAVRFNKIDQLLPTVDVVIVATAAPHYVLTTERVRRSLRKREGEGVLIIDLAQPRNVEESVASLPNVELYTIDDLRSIADENLRRRLGEVGKAKHIIQEELEHLEKLVRQRSIEPTIANLCGKLEIIRQRELKRALKMLGALDEEQRAIIDSLTRVLVKRILQDPLEGLRVAAEKGRAELALAIDTLFKLKERRGD
ncbi:MAG: glutamyl-tRNA reductase [Candidatus Bathyarchaeia archaeon]